LNSSATKIQNGRQVNMLDFVFWTDWGRLISLFTGIDSNAHSGEGATGSFALHLVDYMSGLSIS
jgi:hypothetical protein